MENTPGAEADEKGNIAQTRYNYYFINYRAIVNVVKYKLHKMREKIESEERDNSNRASFVCPQCQSSYTDLQVNQLLDITTGRLFCSFCTTEVEEDQSAGPKTDSRTMLAKVNSTLRNVWHFIICFRTLRSYEAIMSRVDKIVETKIANFIFFYCFVFKQF